jgi:predicted ATPase/class 3 adenylate cyclase
MLEAERQFRRVIGYRDLAKLALAAERELHRHPIVAAALIHDDAMQRDLPSGTVTFLFTDVEGSTQLLQELGAEGYAAELAEHRRLLRNAFAACGGVEVDTQGDAFFVAFPTAPGALEAAQAAQAALTSGPIRVRIGVHTGRPHLTEEGYVGEDIHLGARIGAAGHGGQVLVSPATRALAEAELTDLGEHRLKDFAEPVSIFQLGSERFPPLKTISNTNLPRPVSSFVGRDREVAEVTALVRGEARLVTLSGPGGSGKTRLAIEAAAELVPEFKAGVFWIGLAALRDPGLVAETIAQTLGAKDGLAAHIGERELLLLLDNLEQVIDAAPEVADVLEACPNLRVLVTSRELLRVRGEVDYPVLPLADPDAAQLFSTRAKLNPDETIAELCRRLDNLPLALELAAARTAVLSPAQILDRLAQRLDLLKGGRDADPRQQTLRGTIEWSHDLLTPKDKLVFARLSVFRGGCILDAAEQVCDADLDVLQSLVDKSLLRHTGERFWMLETIREYAVESLEASGEADELRRRHAEHFLALAEEAEPNLRGNPKQWLDRLEAEHDNLRAAFDSLEASGESQLALRLAGALWRFWHDRSHFVEGRRRLEGALAADERPTAARAKALIGAAGKATDARDYATARLRAEEALAINETLGDTLGIAQSRFHIGYAAVEEGDFERAQPIFEQCLRDSHDLGDDFYTLATSFNLAWACDELGDRERARAIREDSLSLARATSDEISEAHILDSLGGSAQREGQFGNALAMFQDALRIFRSLGDRFHTSQALSKIASVLAVTGRERTATRLLARAEVLREEVGIKPVWLEKITGGTLATLHAQLDEADFTEAWEQGTTLALDEAVALAFDSLD